MTNNEVFVNKVIEDMSSYLDSEQIEHLKNSLYINLHGYQINEDSTELVPLGVDGDEMKIKMFIAAKRVANCSEKTIQQYDKQIHRLLNFLGKHVEDITAMDIRYYLGTLKEQNHLASVTIVDYSRYLNSFFSFCLAEGLIKQNPVQQVGPIKVEKTIKKPFSAEDLEALRNACNNSRDRALIEFLYSTGVRVSELVSLNVGNVNFNTEELIVLGKGNKERKTYLTDVARYYLRAYLETRKDEPDLLERPLFVKLRAPHGRMSVSAVEQALKRLGERAGVDDVHPHRFRRTIATDLLNRGMSLEQVKEFLGHESVDTTMIYCDVSNESVKNAHHKYA